MKERPILFSAPMVRALLDGSKTQTRRIVKPQPPHADAILQHHDGVYLAWDDKAGQVMDVGSWKCPYGQPGDRLWVRESFMPAPLETPPEVPRPTRWNFAYAAGGQAEIQAPASYNPMLYNYERWSPSIHMPRWASRINLEVTDVRVERLQEISEADAIAEGCKNSLHLTGGRFANENYAHLWETINGDGSWLANPWVWVIEFQQIPLK